MYDYEFNKAHMAKRVIVKEFLEEFLQFNPDEHYASAYRPNREDLDRKSVDTPAGKLAVDHLKKIDSKFKVKEEIYEATKNVNPGGKKKMVKATIVDKKTGKKKTVLKEVVADQPTPDNTPPSEEVAAAHVLKTSNGKDVITQDPNLPYNARAFIPPRDTFHRLKIYMNENFEKLREACDDLFCQKSYLELAINPYSWHDTEEDAEKFRKQHANEVIAEIFPAHSGKWNFFDSWKEQRESVNFYNDKTIVLEEIIKQVERDERLGQDLMKKRVEKEKRKNDLETGPDAESFKKWRSQNEDLKSLGAEYVSGSVDDDCPDDAIQVDIWKVNKTGDQLIKDKMFTMSEAPTFMKDMKDKMVEDEKKRITTLLESKADLEDDGKLHESNGPMPDSVESKLDMNKVNLANENNMKTTTKPRKAKSK